MPRILKSSSEPASESRLALTCTAVVMALLGLVLSGGGLYLVILGGSPYYISAGLALLVTAALLYARRSGALWWYALILVATSAWAITEVRFDWPQLVPRLGLWFIIGLWLLTPWISRRLLPAGKPGIALATAPLWLASAVVVAVGVLAVSSDYDNRPGELTVADVAPQPVDVGAATATTGDWTASGGTAYGNRYSQLTGITTDNVARLKVAWTYETGESGPDDPAGGVYTPLKVGDTIYLCTPHSLVIALDAGTGQERWRFDPQAGSPAGKDAGHVACRGVSYHDDAFYTLAPYSEFGVVPQAKRVARVSATCPSRVFVPTTDARLIALDATTGKPCEDFGDKGSVKLRGDAAPLAPGAYYSTLPPAVTRDLVIVGGHLAADASDYEASGAARAFDIHDGHQVWVFDADDADKTRPEPHAHTGRSPIGSAFSVDEALGMAYLPMGNPAPEQDGGAAAPEAGQTGAGIVAIDIASGRIKWHYTVARHGLLNTDVGGQPVLVDLKTADGMLPALVATTKQGSIHILDRRTGEPIVPAKEAGATQDAAADEQAASTLDFDPPVITETDMWGSTPFDQLWCRIEFRSLRYDGKYTPPSPQGSLVFPGDIGVFDWGGIAVDPVKQMLFVNPRYLAVRSRLVHGNTAAGPDDKTGGVEKKEGLADNVETRAFLSPLGIPCQAPPRAYVAGVDLRTGTIAYELKTGSVRDAVPLPISAPLGVPSLAGPVITAGGLAFVSGSHDDAVRAYEVRTGRKLWEARLPAGGWAAPMTYADKNGKQFLLVVTGGQGLLGTRQGDHVVAYALPD